MVRELINTHLPRVYRFAVTMVGDRHAAEDFAQEAMLRAWKNRRQLRSASGTGPAARLLRNKRKQTLIVA